MAKSTEWHSDAIDAFFDEGLSYKEIGDRFHVAPNTVTKIVVRERNRRLAEGLSIERKTRQKPNPRAHENFVRLSPTHARIGQLMSHHRQVVNNLSVTEMASSDYLGCSRLLIRKMEAGAHDFSLGELMRISQILEVPLLDLMTPPKGLTPTNSNKAKVG